MAKIRDALGAEPADGGRHPEGGGDPVAERLHLLLAAGLGMTPHRLEGVRPAGR